MSNNKFLVEVKSENTGKSVIKFETENKTSARKEAYNKLVDFLGGNRTVATLNYFVEVSHN